MAKQQSITKAETEVKKTVAAVASAIKAGMPSPQIGKSTEEMAKRRGGRNKAVPAGRNWRHQGELDAAKMLAADSAADQERIKIVAGLSIFAPFGFGPKGKGKKERFSDQAESYFDGWTEFKKRQPEEIQAAINTRRSEARRVLFTMCKHGVKHVSAILEGDGTYHQKIAKMDTMSNRPPKQSKGAEEKKSDKAPGLAELSKAEKAQRVVIMAKFTAKEIGELVSSLTEPQLLPFLHATSIRLNVSKSKVFKALAKTIQASVAEEEKAQDEAQPKKKAA